MALTGVDVRSFELVAGKNIKIELELSVSRCVTKLAPASISFIDMKHVRRSDRPLPREGSSPYSIGRI